METLRSELDEELAARKYWWIFLVTGIFWLILSLILLRFDATSTFTVSLMAGVVAILAGINEFVTAAWSRELRWFRLAFGVLFLAVGIVCLAYPDTTFEIIAAIFAWYLLFKGFLDVVRAFIVMAFNPTWWLLLVVGLIELGLGFWAAGYLRGSAVMLLAWIGIAALIRGITEIVQAFQLRKHPEVTES